MLFRSRRNYRIDQLLLRRNLNDPRHESLRCRWHDHTSSIGMPCHSPADSPLSCFGKFIVFMTGGAVGPGDGGVIAGTSPGPKRQFWHASRPGSGTPPPHVLHDLFFAVSPHSVQRMFDGVGSVTVLTDCLRYRLVPRRCPRSKYAARQFDHAILSRALPLRGP